MMIHKITHFVDYYYRLKPLETQLDEPTNQNSLKFTKLLSQRIRKHLYKTNMGTNKIYSPFSPLSLILIRHMLSEIQCPLLPCMRECAYLTSAIDRQTDEALNCRAA